MLALQNWGSPAGFLKRRKADNRTFWDISIHLRKAWILWAMICTHTASLHARLVEVRHQEHAVPLASVWHQQHHSSFPFTHSVPLMYHKSLLSCNKTSPQTHETTLLVCHYQSCLPRANLSQPFIAISQIYTKGLCSATWPKLCPWFHASNSFAHTMPWHV